MAKQKHSNLPQHIIADPKSRHFYIDCRSKRRIHISKLADHCPLDAAAQEEKHERVMNARWDLNRD